MTTSTSRSQCKQCSLPLPFRQIALVSRPVFPDAEGLCSLCAFQRQASVDFFDHDRYRTLFERRLERIRGKYKYDALVGISGGKDGAFVLHRLVRHYGLKVLAFTFDNGFLNPTVAGKIRQLAASYDVDHFFYRPTQLFSLYRAIIKQAAVPCHACAMGGYYRALAIQLEEHIPLFVHGRSPYQMLRNLDRSSFQNDPFFALIRSNLDEYDATGLAATYARLHAGMVQAMGQLELTETDRAAILEEFFSPLVKISADFVPESFAYFLTEHYDEAAIRATLAAAGYVSPSSHDDCLIHNAANYLTAQQYGVSVATMECAAAVRVGHVATSQMEQTLETDCVERLRRLPVVVEELRSMCDTLGLSVAEVAVWPSLT